MATKNILPGTGDTAGVMDILVPFNMIVDTDVGLLCLILQGYMDPQIFNKSFFFDKKVTDLVYELYIRDKENPLYLCINDEYKDSCDNLYEQFMEEEYPKILDLSVRTEFYRLLSAYNNDSDIRYTIVCEKQIEIDILRTQENTMKSNIILSDSLKPADIKKFNQFFFKSIPDATPYAKYLDTKAIYFANYGFNKKEDGDFVQDPLIDLLMMNNKLFIIDVYNVQKIKGGK